jgi:hypothetical protein
MMEPMLLPAQQTLPISEATKNARTKTDKHF